MLVQKWVNKPLSVKQCHVHLITVPLLDLIKTL